MGKQKQQIRTPMYRWWDYVRKIVRAYPALEGRELNNPDDIRDRDAVAQAIEETRESQDGAEHIALIRYVYWNPKQHKVRDAAPQCHVSEATAKRWHGEFIKAVAKNRGFYVNDTVKLE